MSPNPTRKTRSAAAAVLSVLFITSTFQSRAIAQPRKSNLAQINSYVAEVDRYIKRNAKSQRIFGNTAQYDDDSKPRWREFKTEAESEEATLYEAAYVWTRAGKVIGANFTFTSPSGDWAHFVMYYFRDDGSLAKIQARLNTFYGDLSIVRDQYFNNAGVRLSSTRKFLDLDTQKPKKPGEYFDHPVPVYRKVKELPFYRLL